LVEPALADAQPGNRDQFLRHGYFIVDADTRPGKLVFNRIVELPDAYTARQTGADAERKAKSEAASAVQSEAVVGSLSEERVRARASDAGLAERYSHYVDALELSPEQADPLTGSRAVVTFFEAALASGASARTAANWINNEVLRELKDSSIDDLAFSGADLGELARLVDDGAVTTAAAKTIYAEMAAGKGAPQAIVRRLGLDQTLSTTELTAIVQQVLATLPDKVAEYQSGKTSLLGMFTGQVMRATGNKADPKQVQALLKQQLEA
ncbi:MAG TPA: glutamine--tRNA ligase, partial [Caldilinea sp.]|nr:glutamine--tRNA ligase [Caldilinea sp.]